jgi:LDH2 family malate/lactate/ureidoglycolate dehydrogenase
VQVLDPDAFAGREAFTRQTDVLAEACRASEPRPGIERVRLPGENALALRRAALVHGVELYAGLGDELRASADRLGVQVPEGL